MQKHLVLLSTGVGLVPVLVQKVKELAPDVKVNNIVDDSVIGEIAKNGNIIPPNVYARICRYCRSAEEMGADALLLTCSSISETLDTAKDITRLPLFKIDEPMAKTAVERAKEKVGVVATLETTLAPTCRQIASNAQAAHKLLEIQRCLCADAYDAYLSGDEARHDDIVKKNVEQLLRCCDVVVLAQASMVTAIKKLSEEQRARVLTSPDSGIHRVVDYLYGVGVAP